MSEERYRFRVSRLRMDGRTWATGTWRRFESAMGHAVEMICMPRYDWEPENFERIWYVDMKVSNGPWIHYYELNSLGSRKTTVRFVYPIDEDGKLIAKEGINAASD